jgi:hypothetical protein
MASDVVFLSRNTAFESERRVTLTLEGVVRIEGGQGETRIPILEIGLIELGAESSFVSGTCFVCQIYRKRAWFPTLTLKSKRYRGPNDFVDQRGDYRALVNALHAQIVTNAWPVKTQVSARPAALMHGLWSYAHWALLIGIAAFVLMLFALAALDPPWTHAIPGISLAASIVATLAYLASKLANIRAAYGPWPYDPRCVPASLLPEILAGD